MSKSAFIAVTVCKSPIDEVVMSSRKRLKQRLFYDLIKRS